jgi:HK97 family phage portal protein
VRLWPKRENRDVVSNLSLKNPTEAFVRDLNFFGASFAGKNISPDSAVSGTIAVYACISIIADAVATLPMLLYDFDENGDRQRIPDTDPFANMLHRQPNPEMSAQEFYECVTAHVCLWGNSYSLIERNQGSPVALWPLRPDRMRVFLVDQDQNVLDPWHFDPVTNRNLKRAYYYELPTGEFRILDRMDILHIRGLGTNGFLGLSPIATARNAIGIEQAANEYAGKLYANSSVPSGILNVPMLPNRPNLSENDKRKIRSDWNALHAGASNSQKLAILEGGATWQQVGLPPEDAQFIETRKFQIIEIARLFRVPPHLIGDVERSTSWGTGIEQQNLGFYTLTLRPWLERIEQAMNRDLGYGRGGQSLSQLGLSAEFLVEGLLRGDTATRFAAYEVAIRNRIMVPNEARKKENMAPLAGGDNPFVPTNFTSVPEPSPPPDLTGDVTDTET